MAKTGLGRNIRVAAVVFAFLLGVGLPVCATASPVLGQPIYYEGGHVSVTVLPFDAGYTSNLYLFSGGNSILIANSSQVGKVVDLGNLAALYNVKPGDELIFGIFVLNTGNTFLMGPGARNADGVAHAVVDYAEGTTSDFATLGFEDLFGGGDRDYNDANFQLEGGIGITRIPEPASLVLLVLGVVGLALVSRALFGVRCREDAGSALR